MPVAICEPHHLVLDGRTIARSAAGDCSTIYRGQMQVLDDQRMRVRRGAGDATDDLRVVDPVQ